MANSNISVKSLPLKGAYLISTFLRSDLRGNFIKDYSHQILKDLGVDYEIKEVFYSKSCKGTIRGLHFQKEPKAQAKLVRCVHGKIFDVIVDLRKDSPTYKKWMGFYLSEDNNSSLLIPVGFAHGFLALEDDSIVSYKCSIEFDSLLDSGIRYDSPLIGVKWPLEKLGETKITISPKDANLEVLK